MPTHAVVTGGAGFIGSHLCEALLDAGAQVTAVDNLLTGRAANLDTLGDRDGFRFVEHDVTLGLAIDEPVDAVFHFASPASPPRYLAYPIETLEAGALGTRHALDLASKNSARFVLASTSEVYGDPLVHPQSESYWGNVNPVGPRSVYDEAKRYAEAITMAYHRSFGTDTKIARIFNTYGERLDPDDGRVVSNFLSQVLDGAPLTIYGNGTQSRSFCHVSDLVRGVLALLGSDHVGPVNLGSPDEYTMLELAALVREVAGADPGLVFQPLPVDDPSRRRPDLTLAEHLLGWHPDVSLRDGLHRAYAWYQKQRERGRI